MGRQVGAVATALTVVAIVAPAAAADPARSLSASRSVLRTCEEQLLPASAPAAARTAWTAPGAGYLTVELRGGSAPDWDLALFRLPGREPLAASTSFTSAESTTVWVPDGERVSIQACRRAGQHAEIPLEISFYAFDPHDLERERVAMVSVTLAHDQDLGRLGRLGFDVTHDIQPGSATVVTYSDEERSRLRAAGFEFVPLIRDLVAADASDRAAEAHAAELAPTSRTPGGRTAYREYADFTTEMKDLATANPTLVRSIEIGRSVEDAPIEGVEIAADVNRSDDGRPVFLNFGAHHAREWPSAEMPMEFALDLVQRWNASDARVRTLLDNVRVVIVPVVNVDGFKASRSFGFNPATDDDELLTLAESAAGIGAYRRKNCRPAAGEAGVPCEARTSGVDLNRNYGAYWGGPGSSSDPTSQAYRSTAPFSEPESEAVHQFTAGIHPTVFITNHTFTEGRWLRQPGFDAEFLPQALVPTYDDGCAANDDGDMGAIAPDEAAMKDLGDDMAAANGWISELGYETLCDITGATEDWNYFSQGTYGYTPEIRGTNFHANYATMVVAEYDGGTPSNPLGMGESFLIAAERAADPAEHGIIQGTAPPGATLILHKEFDTPTCDGATCAQGAGPPIQDVLDTRLTAPGDGTYGWHVNPSGRPLFPAETYTMTCQVHGGPLTSEQVAVGRGQTVTENFGEGCAAGGGGGGYGEGTASCRGQQATISGTDGNDRLKGTGADDVIAGGRGDDRIKGKGGEDRICGRGGRDRIAGGAGADQLRGGGGPDRIRGGAGLDRCKGGRGKDEISGCP